MSKKQVVYAAGLIQAVSSCGNQGSSIVQRQFFCIKQIVFPILIRNKDIIFLLFIKDTNFVPFNQNAVYCKSMFSWVFSLSLCFLISITSLTARISDYLQKIQIGISILDHVFQYTIRTRNGKALIILSMDYKTHKKLYKISLE